MLPTLHSTYSLLAGTIPVHELVNGAAKFGYETIALTDTDNLTGAIVFYKYCLEKGIKPIIGVELTTDAGVLTLLASDARGYANICALITERHLQDCPVPLTSVRARHEGIICIAHACDAALALHDVFNARGYLAVFDRGMYTRMKFAAEHHLQPVAFAPVYFVSPSDYSIHQVLTAMRLNTSVARLREGDAQPSEYYFHSPDELARIFAPFPELIANAAAVAKHCQFAFSLGKYSVPQIADIGSDTASSTLMDHAFTGARARYGTITPDIAARLNKELQAIDTLGYSDYFLVAYDIVEYCRREGIPLVGRGSAASSIVSYVLGITDICPIRYGLYFERFLNAERPDPPDIDLDICGRRRDEVLDYVYRRHGADHVATVCSIITMQSRMAVREVSKALGLTEEEISYVTRRLPRSSLEQSMTVLKHRPEGKDVELETEPFKTVIALCTRIDGFPRHLGMHPCGVIISPEPLYEHVPLERSAKGLVVTQYDMYSIDDLGLIKIDLLGQRALTLMGDVVEHLNKRGVTIDLRTIPEDDPETMELVRRGDTLGIFQIESPGMRTLLKQMPVRDINDICLALSLIRPGAADSGSKEQFVKIVNGRAKAEYLCAELKPILEDSYGCVIYQEQVMRIVERIGGLSLAEADQIRRAMTKGNGRQRMKDMEQAFLNGARRIVDGATAKRIWELVAKFSGFGYCKAHAMTYACISYREAYLKTHYPAEYLAAMCSSGTGYYYVSVYVEEAKRLGLRVLLPDVNRSEYRYTVEEGAIRIGFMQIRNLSGNTVQNIVDARTHGGCFASFEDVLSRVTIDEAEVETLIQCGAFDAFGSNRPELLWTLKLSYRRYRRPPEEAPLIASEPPAITVPHVSDYSPDEKYERELALMGVTTRCHPTTFLYPGNEDIPSNRLREYAGREITIAGRIVAHRRTMTRHHQEMLFLTCENHTGVFEVILWPEVCSRYGGVMFESRMVEVTGTVEKHGQIVAACVKGIVNT